jgi:hypothetical protein
MKKSGYSTQRGQSLVLVALMMIILMAFLALVFDGGMTFATRRQAQNAADSAALAGARTLCLSRSESLARSVAENYASRNGATSAIVEVSLQDRRVTVTARIPLNTFFAHFIGRAQMPVQASASAGCFSPTTGEGVLPVAWVCRPAINEDLSDSEDCQEQRLSYDELQNRLNNPPPPPGIWPELYILMDSQSLPNDLTQVCQIPNGGYLDCDLDNDGDNELVANGDRSWLDLDGGGGGSSELVDWVNGQNVPDLRSHTWLGGQSGTANNVFQAAAGREGQFVILPVFNHLCDDYPNPKCSENVHPQDTILTSAGGNYYYHIITFAIFYVTCVNASGVHHGECPGHKVARDLGVFSSISGANATNPKSIEGYFIQGFVPGLSGGPGGDDIDTGAYTLYLTR